MKGAYTGEQECAAAAGATACQSLQVATHIPQSASQCAHKRLDNSNGKDWCPRTRTAATGPTKTALPVYSRPKLYTMCHSPHQRGCNPNSGMRIPKQDQGRNSPTPFFLDNFLLDKTRWPQSTTLQADAQAASRPSLE